MLTFKQFSEDFSGGATTTGSVAGIGRDRPGSTNAAEPPKKTKASTLIRRKNLQLGKEDGGQ